MAGSGTLRSRARTASVRRSADFPRFSVEADGVTLAPPSHMRTFLEDIGRDIRHGWRLLQRARGFTLTAVVVLAVCIGANSAVFSTVNALLLRPLPYPDADRLVHAVITTRAGHTLDTSVPKFVAWSDSTREFSALTAFQ